MSTVNYCANGCTTRHGDTWHAVTTEGASTICRRCEDRIHEWLVKIPDNYALLPHFAEHGVVEKNPDSKATKSVNAAAPMRLDVVDLLDHRLGRKWLGTAPAHDRRGPRGTLRVHLERLAEERPLTHVDTHDPTVVDACRHLDRHRLWIGEQAWATEMYDDLRILNRQLADAVGDYRRPPIGKCHVPADDETPCGGNLYANTYGGVRCSRCQATWDADHLRQLGRAQASNQ